MFAAISYTDESHELLKTSIELRRQLNEMLLQGAIMDLKENGQFSGVLILAGTETRTETRNNWVV